jgi:UDP-N-acetylglucosamine--N-acetylmuramyl-(pentapeptide) pyrophosphoryl-undecaprenol N-acetylglucosamine transferase
MEYGYAAADVVISRAGAMAVAELGVVGKPVVFVPYPFAAEDHQTANAQALVKSGAACMVKDSEAKESAIPLAIEIVEDEAKAAQLKTNMAQYAVIDADELIANEIVKNINE